MFDTAVLPSTIVTTMDTRHNGVGGGRLQVAPRQGRLQALNGSRCLQAPWPQLPKGTWLRHLGGAWPQVPIGTWLRHLGGAWPQAPIGTWLRHLGGTWPQATPGCLR